MKRLWKHYGLTIVLMALFVVSWILQTWMGWREFASEQRALGEPAHWIGPDGYVWAWGNATFENWQSEFLQLLTFAMLTAHLFHRGSAESRDGEEILQDSVDRIEARLMRLEERLAKIDDDEDLEALIIERVEKLKLEHALREGVPAPVPREWYPRKMRDAENEERPDQLH